MAFAKTGLPWEGCRCCNIFCDLDPDISLFSPQYSSEPLAIHEYQLLSLDLELVGGGIADLGAGTDSSGGPFPEL
ncbi:MAG: hypothetical protein RR882_09695 [Comamonas sp.]